MGKVNGGETKRYWRGAHKDQQRANRMGPTGDGIQRGDLLISTDYRVEILIIKCS